MRRWQKVLLAIPVVLFLLYILLGFFVAPHIFKHVLEKKGAELIGRQVYVSRVSINPLLLNVRLWGFQLLDEDNSMLIGFRKLLVDVSWSSLWKKAVVFDRIGLEKPVVKLVVSTAGKLNLSELGAKKNASAPAAEAAKSSSPKGLPVVITSLWLNRGAVMVRDMSRSQPFQHVFQPIDLQLSNVSTRLGETTAFYLESNLGDTGKASVQASFCVDPLQADATVLLSAIPLPLFDSYVRSAVPLQMASGSLSARSSVSYTTENSLRLNSDIRVADVSVTDIEKKTEMLGWKDLLLENISVEPARKLFSVGTITLDGLRAAITIEPDGRLNINRILASASPQKPPQSASASSQSAEPAATGAPLSIGTVTLREGALLFRDESVQPHPQSHIEKLAVTVTGIAPDPASQIHVKAAATLDRAGSFDLQASLTPFAPGSKTQITAALKGFELVNVSPYFGKYLGFVVDKGDLSLAVSYQISPKKLEAANHLVTHALTLGEKVESPDALKVPIKLALSLLEDRNQQIDLELPIEGDPQNPEFRIGKIVIKTFVNTMTKLVLAPFSFLGGLAGGKGGDLNFVVFAAGDAAMSDAEKEKIKSLAKALSQRPRLILEIQSAVNREVDSRALQEAAFEQELKTRYPQSAKNKAPYIQSYFKKRLGGKQFNRVSRDFKLKARKAGVRFDEAAFGEELRREVVAAQPLDAKELTSLAERRAQAIAEALRAEPGVEPERVINRPPTLDAKAESNNAKIELFLSVR